VYEHAIALSLEFLGKKQMPAFPAGADDLRHRLHGFQQNSPARRSVPAGAQKAISYQYQYFLL
jgi:hypothetical protein